jgi:hypothetical protein
VTGETLRVTVGRSRATDPTRGAHTSPADLDLSGGSRRSREARSNWYPDRGSALGPVLQSEEWLLDKLIG